MLLKMKPPFRNSYSILVITICFGVPTGLHRVPPKFLRAARGASKALIATNYGPPAPSIPQISSPRKVVVDLQAAKLSRNVVSAPRSRYYKTGYGRSRRRKTQRKKVKKRRRPSYPYGVPVYAQKFKYYKPYNKRPSRYKSRPTSSRRPVKYVRVPIYKDHEVVEEPEDYEGEYDMRAGPHQDFDDEEIKDHPPKYVYDSKTPPLTKDQIRKQKYSSKYKGHNIEWEDNESNKEIVDNGYRTIIPKPTPMMSSRPSFHPIYEEQDNAPYWGDTDTAFTNQPSPTAQPSRTVPPYIITSNNYGGRYNYSPYSQQFSQPNTHQFTPPSNHNRPNNHDADIGYGQGMEIIEERPRSIPWG